MRWERVSHSSFTDFIRFVIRNEWKSVTLSSRVVNRDGSFRQLDRIDGEAFCCTAGSGGMIKGIMLLTASGLILPVWDSSVSAETMAESYRSAGKLLSGMKRKSCILGTETDVEGVVLFLKPSVEAEIKYDLMTAEKPDRLYPPEQAEGITVRKAGPKEAERIFRLEKSYLLEEVVIDRRRFSSPAAFANLKNNCKTQIVLYAEREGIPVAKANTNAMGINYAQIGGVYTDSAHRKHGYSTLLMKHLLFETALKKKKAVLFVKKDNVKAINLYRKTGFAKIDSYSIVYIRH